MRWTFSILFFFFSSRRRHTRYWRDWSSDVCSSDLRRGPGARPPVGERAASTHPQILETSGPPAGHNPPRSPARSEERRVGEECRYRGSAHHLKKKQDILRTTLIYRNNTSHLHLSTK